MYPNSWRTVYSARLPCPLLKMTRSRSEFQGSDGECRTTRPYKAVMISTKESAGPKCAPKPPASWPILNTDCLERAAILAKELSVRTSTFIVASRHRREGPGRSRRTPGVRAENRLLQQSRWADRGDRDQSILRPRP